MDRSDELPIPFDPEVAESDRPVPGRSIDELFGGRRGLVDSVLPTVVFVLVNIRWGLDPAIRAAVVVAGVLFGVRIVRREQVRHAVSGFLGILFAAWLARTTGKSEDFFLPGLLLNGVYCLGLVVSVLFRRPLIGFLLKQFSDQPEAYHDDPAVRRAYTEVTLFWAATFGIRLAVQGPLYAAGETGWLGVAKIVLGVPIYLAALAVTLPWVRRRTAGVEISQP